MPVVRARISDVTTALAGLLHEDGAGAAGGNDLLSKSEQKKAPAHVQAAAEQVRSAGGAGTRVTVDALDTALQANALALIASVNQSSGSGAPFLSLAEAQQAASRDPALGGRVMKAYEIALGKAVDVDAVAVARVRANLAGNPDAIFKTFATETDAENFRGPSGKSVYWLVVDGETATTKSYTQGVNDLWAARFDVDKTTGAVTITAEH